MLSATTCFCDAYAIPEHAFFEQPVFEGDLRERPFQGGRLGSKLLDLRRLRLKSSVTGQALVPGLQEFLGPLVV